MISSKTGKDKEVWSDDLFPLFLCGLFYDPVCLSDTTASMIVRLTDNELDSVWKEAFIGW
jgi:hypothetical protein